MPSGAHARVPAVRPDRIRGQAKAATTAQLICSSSQAADVNHAEITALKVPGVRVIKG